jgi:Mn2+/Fe2+ NRAMP family transporter
MTRETADVIAIVLWALGLVPVTLLLQWLGAIPYTWGGFIAAYFVLALLTLGFELFQRWIRRLLYRRVEAKDATLPPPR